LHLHLLLSTGAGPREPRRWRFPRLPRRARRRIDCPAAHAAAPLKCLAARRSRAVPRLWPVDLLSRMPWPS